MTDCDIQTRALRLDDALMRYGERNQSRDETLVDLLADAQHWCDAFGQDFHLCLARACRHFYNELSGDQLVARRRV